MQDMIRNWCIFALAIGLAPLSAKTKKQGTAAYTGVWSNLQDMGRVDHQLDANMTASMKSSDGEGGAVRGKWKMSGNTIILIYKGNAPVKCLIAKTDTLDFVPSEGQPGVALKCNDSVGGTLFRKVKKVEEPLPESAPPQ